MYSVQQKNNLFLARLPRISVNLNENYRPYNLQALANISRNFRKISRNIKFPENLQPYRPVPSSRYSHIALVASAPQLQLEVLLLIKHNFFG